MISFKKLLQESLLDENTGNPKYLGNRKPENLSSFEKRILPSNTKNGKLYVMYSGDWCEVLAINEIFMGVGNKEIGNGWVPAYKVKELKKEMWVNLKLKNEDGQIREPDYTMKSIWYLKKDLEKYL